MPSFDIQLFIEVFLRSLGFIYLLAFASLLFQIEGLYNSTGVMPIAHYFSGRELNLKDSLLGFLRLPAIFWFRSSDFFINLCAWLGLIFALLLSLNIMPTISLIMLYILYLSFTNVGAPFMNFQWDILLLEVGFLAIWLSVFNDFEYAFGIAFMFLLYKFLVFKLMLMSGLVKRSSGDQSWSNLSALNYHYETQPIPNLIAFYVHQLPVIFHKISVILMFVIELLLPFFIFMGDGMSKIAAIGFMALQVLIMLTGNYCFFNLLTILLCLFLFVPQAVIFGSLFLPVKASLALWISLLILVMGSMIILIDLLYVFRSAPISNRIRLLCDRFLKSLLYFIAPLSIVNGYGLFAVMTTDRFEVVIQGTNDLNGEWQDYEFKYKVGDPRKAPPQVAPHQPRLDWQMWFAALSDYKRNPWLVNMVIRLLEGSPAVLKLLAHNPFPDAPPQYIRALLYVYSFNDLESQSTSGEYWQRKLVGAYLPELNLS